MKFVGVKCESSHKQLLVRQCEVSQNDTLEMIFDFAEPRSAIFVRIFFTRKQFKLKKIKFPADDNHKGEFRFRKFVQVAVQNTYIRLLWIRNRCHIEPTSQEPGWSGEDHRERIQSMSNNRRNGDQKAGDERRQAVFDLCYWPVPIFGVFLGRVQRISIDDHRLRNQVCKKQWLTLERKTRLYKFPNIFFFYSNAFNEMHKVSKIKTLLEFTSAI